MPKQIKICRVCGVKYEACNSARTGSGVFNWREVACSPECGMAYLEKVTASRSIVEPAEEPVVTKVSRKKVNEKRKPEVEPVVEAEIVFAEPTFEASEDTEATE